MNYRKLRKRRQFSEQIKRQAVADYNTKRLHHSLGRCSPAQYESSYWQRPEARRKLEVIRSENTPAWLKGRLQGKDIDTS